MLLIILNWLPLGVPSLDNPDQRMTYDVDLLCTNFGSIISDVIVAPFTIGYYAYSAYTRLVLP